MSQDNRKNKRNRTAFFIRAYNDLDHLSPVIWKFIKSGDEPIVIFHTDLDYESDYRIKFLLSEGHVEIYQFKDEEYVTYQKDSKSIISKISKRLYNLKRNRKRLFGRVYRKLFFDCSSEIRFLKENNISQCVFEWGTPYARGLVIEKFFKAAKGLGVTTFCLPHGCNIYTHSDVNQGYTNSIRLGRIPDQSQRREYDYYIFQNPLRRDGWVKWGYDPVKTFAWGSTRFYPEWQEKNLTICPSFSPNTNKDPTNKLKVVFMDHQKDYNIILKSTWNLIEGIVKDKRIFLVIKQSTRAGKDYHSKSFRNKYKIAPNIEFVGNEAHSPALINWADCVINFGSSIGIEVLLQNKPLINPTFLHKNRTLYEETGACIEGKSQEEVLYHLKKIKENKSYNIPTKNKDILFREIIYGGREKHDVLESYYEKIIAKHLAY
ncbi:MAG: hypothetical protein KAS32_27995 [Candidatus Peribacteraceae bacterium]|nr:hypothetical protein [Candidatus Peribacteraceae bacterium]